MLGDRAAAEDAFRTAMILDHTQRKRVRGFVTQRLIEPEDESSDDNSDDENPTDGSESDE